jgi:hypothetical protein
MMPVPGHHSAKRLRDALITAVGLDSFFALDELSIDQDAFGFRVRRIPTVLFSVSTSAGQLADGMYDMMASNFDGTREHGMPVFVDSEIELNDLVEVVKRYAAGEMVKFL